MFNNRRFPSWNLSGRVAVVSGAGSGLGRALCQQLLAAGAHVALGEVDGPRLAATVRDLDPGGRRTRATRVDVADAAGVQAWASQVQAHFGRVDLVVNNAGITRFQALASLDGADFERLMAVNFWGVVHGTRAFLPLLERASAGRLVNVSSVFGLFAFPAQGAYCASKFAVRGYTEALATELSLAGSRVRACCVHPCGVATRIARDAAGPGEPLLGDPGRVRDFFEGRLAGMSAEEAARRILDGVRRGRRRILVGPGARELDLLQRVAPVRHGRAIEAWVRFVRWRHLGRAA